MNQRIPLKTIADHIRPLVPLAARVGTAYDRDYIQAVQGAPAAVVWVIGQRHTPRDDGGGGAGCYFQRMKVEIAMRLVVPRYLDGEIDAEARMNALHDQVTAAMRKYQPGEAWTQFVLGTSQDGPANESVCTVDVFFTADVLYTERP
ncbi:hypothetical protein FHW12_000351 [Dokdonella fugitiva]|uniref:Gp37 protein n=1 Tax=Dokdonella fugitiva TaxID=328517 RepID=A0A839EZ19_9GAMM|nr:hypothetical protein [Dokdonella fugitiva]MBA8886160.1 hypothetical protein [Dokdonella fugitiva]